MPSSKTASLALVSVLAFVGFSTIAVRAQTTPASTGSTPANADAEAQWALVSRDIPFSTAPQSTNLAAANRSVQQKTVAQLLVDQSKQANDFYTKYPSHPKARQAKKIEAISAVRATQAGAVEEEPRAYRLGMAFRNDSSNDEKDRFQVASTMADASIAKKGSTSGVNILDEYEKKADSLVAEFPKNGDVYRIYFGVMRFSPPEKAKVVAQKILLAPAPAEVKADTQAFLDRMNMVGQKVPLEFVSVDGKNFNLADQAGKIVIAYVWTAQSPYASVLFQAVSKGAVPVGATMVGINIDQDIVAAAAEAKKDNAPGLQYSDKRGLKGPVATRLKVFDVPFCYVFGKDGHLVGFGSSDDLPSLIAAAGK